MITSIVPQVQRHTCLGASSPRARANDLPFTNSREGTPLNHPHRIPASRVSKKTAFREEGSKTRTNHQYPTPWCSSTSQEHSTLSGSSTNLRRNIRFDSIVRPLIRIEQPQLSWNKSKRTEWANTEHYRS